MPDGASFSLSLHSSIHEIDAQDWNACAGDDNPFVGFAFLSAVEDSGSAGSRTGWLPQHAVLRDEANQIVGIVPMYAKSHSYGEYVFDHGWANAFERAGGSYYPKLQAAVPFSPVPGPRLLRRPGSNIPVAALAQGLVQACQQLDLSSVHITFCQDEEWAALGQAGWLQRIGTQFHWTNAGYTSFDDLRSRSCPRIVMRIADKLAMNLTPEGGAEIARRSRGTPRIAGRLTRRIRDFAAMAGDMRIDRAVADAALTRLEVDAQGLDAMDMRYLRRLAEHYNGGPVGVETLAAALAEARDTLEDVVEPYLIQEGFLLRTSRGRMLGDAGWRHLGLAPPRREQPDLLDPP